MFAQHELGRSLTPRTVHFLLCFLYVDECDYPVSCSSHRASPVCCYVSPSTLDCISLELEATTTLLSPPAPAKLLYAGISDHSNRKNTKTVILPLNSMNPQIFKHGRHDTRWVPTVSIRMVFNTPSPRSRQQLGHLIQVSADTVHPEVGSGSQIRSLYPWLPSPHHFRYQCPGLLYTSFQQPLYYDSHSLLLGLVTELR